MVFVASKNGLAASPNAADCCTAKAAEIHLARYLALEGAEAGFRVNVVNTDAFLRGSKIWEGDWLEQRAGTCGTDVDGLEEMYRQRSMLKRSVFPEDIAEACYFFASDRSADSNGNIINVDAGNVQAFTQSGTKMSYASAKIAFVDWGVDAEAALRRLGSIKVSMHCWQGDDLVGFEKKTGSSADGIQATLNNPGRARTPDELRADLDFACSMIPGKHRLNLHAMYLDTQATLDQDEIEFQHFAAWVDWARDQDIGLDFNPTFLAHSKAHDNLTLSHPDQSIRDFRIEHGRRSRDMAAQMGSALGSPSVNNI